MLRTTKELSEVVLSNSKSEGISKLNIGSVFKVLISSFFTESRKFANYFFYGDALS